VTHRRVRGRRIGGILAASLFILSTIPGLVAAANNRNVYFGSPAPDGTGGNTLGTPIVYGTLGGETKVTEGGRTAVKVLIKNNDNQTLNHVKFAAGTNADAKPDNATNTTPSGTSLPQDADGNPLATIATVFSDSSATTCTPTTLPASGVDCELGQLVTGASVTLTVIINVPAAKGNYSYWVTGSWNEGWSTTGTNADYNFATGTLKVLESNCGNGQSSYFLPTEPVALTDGGSTDQCATQDAAIQSGLALGNKGGLAQVAIDSANITCPAIYKCFGKPVSVSILGGNSVPGGVQWTVTWFGIKTLKGVLHVSDSGTTFTPIYLTKAYKCTDTLLRDCWKTVTTSVGNAKPAFVTVVFVTDSNGKGIGF
jgi:hypothetical protein